jgi:hypothetical protein
MKRKSGLTGVVSLLVLVVMLLGLLYSYSSAQQKTSFIIYVRGNKKDLGGVDQRFVSVEDFFNYFGVPVESLEQGKSAKIGHLYYNKQIRSVGGKAYTDGVTLLKFFGMPYTQANNWTFKLNIASIPMFNRTYQKFQDDVQVTIDNKSQSVTVLNLNGSIYLPLESLDEIIRGKQAIDNNGRLTLEGKQIDRWLLARNKTYVLVDDLRTVIGKPISVK